ncbi:MAG: contractile injection system tape measure protein [Cyclobacteriaceae bacterium]
MASVNHIIHKQLIDIKVSDKAEAQRWQDEFSSYFKCAVLQALERACDELCPENEYIRINKLEIDLGMVRKGKLRPELAQRLIMKFKQEILKVASDRLSLIDPTQTSKKEGVPEGVSAISGKSASLYDTVMYYLEYGMLPWWTSANGFNTRKSINELIGDKAEKFPEKHFLNKVRTLLTRKHCQLRVIEVFTANELNLILDPEARHSLLKLYNDFKKIDSRKSLKFIFFKNVLAHATLAPSGFDLIDMRKTMLDTLQELGFADRLTLLSILKKKAGPECPLVHLIGKYLKEDQSTNAAQSELIDRKSGKLSGKEEDDIEGVDQFGMSLFNEKTSLETSSNDQVGAYKKHQDFDQDRTPEFSLQPDDTMEIASAGTVLLWPYLQMFFKELKLVEKGGFLDKACQEKAVQLLHYLVNGDAETEEYQWILFKLLCGMEPVEFVPTVFELGESEKKECGNLLRSVIRNWAVLKNTSPAGLQSSFLQRPGLLKQDQNGWIVHIERIAIDVLLDRLSWPISVIRLPWNKNAIYVRW